MSKCFFCSTIRLILTSQKINVSFDGNTEPENVTTVLSRQFQKKRIFAIIENRRNMIKLNSIPASQAKSKHANSFLFAAYWHYKCDFITLSYTLVMGLLF